MMIIMKKIVVISFMGTCMLSMAACGTKTEEKTTAETAIEAAATTETITETTEVVVESAAELKEKPEETSLESFSEDSVNPELKEALDAYEEFFDGYVEFMKKYQTASPEEMLAMMSDYTNYVLQYTDMIQKMQKIQREELSTQDAAYYIEVTARIEKKLLSVTE